MGGVHYAYVYESPNRLGVELPCSPSGAYKKGTPIEKWHLGTKHPSLETPESVSKLTSSSMELRASLLSDWVGLEGDPIDV